MVTSRSSGAQDRSSAQGASTDTAFFRAPTPDGWLLALKRVYRKDALNSKGFPIALIPGYGMNSFIFGYHPSGLSMEAFFAERGFEVWSVDMRGQGRSLQPSGGQRYGLHDLAVVDLATLFRFIADHTLCDGKAVHALGCSLGGSLVFAHVALSGTDLVRSVVPMGAPLRWDKLHPIIRLFSYSPRLARWLPHKHLRELASVVFPLALRVPWTLHAYLHPEISDTRDYGTLLNTVNDTSPLLNQEVAQWLKDTDLCVGGQSISGLLPRVDRPLLCVVANGDGIVPAETCLSAFQQWGSQDKTVLVVGTAKLRFAHADLFISDYSQEHVFGPIAAWLAERNAG
ncbi:alpha/beta hydrolase [Planctomycetota bacterium]